MMGDWLQGPYVYALYSSYGFSQHDIAVLFVAGFGSSMFFGTFIGALADRYGRKKMCTAYCLLYIVSCMTKHFNNYWILMVGRLTGGIATSLLFSAFEAWMVSSTLSSCFDDTRGCAGRVRGHRSGAPVGRSSGVGSLHALRPTMHTRCL